MVGDFLYFGSLLPNLACCGIRTDSRGLKSCFGSPQKTEVHGMKPANKALQKTKAGHL